MEKSFVCKGLSVVSRKNFVKMGKTMRWVTFFATGDGPQQSPLTHSKVLHTIRGQARDHVKARLADIHDVDEGPEVEVEDLSERIGHYEGTFGHIGCSRGLGFRIRRGLYGGDKNGDERGEYDEFVCGIRK